MRKFLVIFFVLVFSTYAFGQEKVKVGFIDMQRAINDSEAGKTAKKDLEGMIKERQGKIDGKIALRDKLLAEVEKQAVVLSEEARAQKEGELEKLVREIERMIADSNTELQQSQRELEVEIFKELQEIIDGVGKEGGYTIILPFDIVLYSPAGNDITDLIIEKHNALFKSKKGSKKKSRKR
jgi:outer membrane protein